MGDLHTSSSNALKTTLTRSLLMRPVFLDVEVGDVMAVSKPGEKAYLAQVIYVEGGARTADPNYLQVVREPDCAVMNIYPSWITQRLPRGPEPEPQDLGKRRWHSFLSVNSDLFSITRLTQKIGLDAQVFFRCCYWLGRYVVSACSGNAKQV